MTSPCRLSTRRCPTSSREQGVGGSGASLALPFLRFSPSGAGGVTAGCAGGPDAELETVFGLGTSRNGVMDRGATGCGQHCEEARERPLLPGFLRVL